MEVSKCELKTCGKWHVILTDEEMDKVKELVTEK